MRLRILCLSLLSVFAGGTVAHAHPGHGSTAVPSDSPLHWIVEPTHLIVPAAIAMLIIAGMVVAKRLQAKPAKAYAKKG